MSLLTMFKRHHPSKKDDAKAEEVLIIDGSAHMTTKLVCMIENITPPTLRQYVREGLERSPYSMKSQSLYDIKEVSLWRKKNKGLNGGHSKSTDGDDESGTYDGETITELNAKIAKEVEDAREKRLKRRAAEDEEKIRRKEWLPAHDVDRSQVNLIRILLQGLTNMVLSLPPKLKNRNQEAISTVLDAEFSSMLSKLKRELKKYE